jgi:hypothetical protein
MAERGYKLLDSTDGPNQLPHEFWAAPSLREAVAAVVGR